MSVYRHPDLPRRQDRTHRRHQDDQPTASRRTTRADSTRTLKQRAPDVPACFGRPGTSNGSTAAINGRLERLRGTSLGFRDLTNYITDSRSTPAASDPDYTLFCDEPDTRRIPHRVMEFGPDDPVLGGVACGVKETVVYPPADDDRTPATTTCGCSAPTSRNSCGACAATAPIASRRADNLERSHKTC